MRSHQWLLRRWLVAIAMPGMLGEGWAFYVLGEIFPFHTGEFGASVEDLTSRDIVTTVLPWGPVVLFTTIWSFKSGVLTQVQRVDQHIPPKLGWTEILGVWPGQSWRLVLPLKPFLKLLSFASRSILMRESEGGCGLQYWGAAWYRTQSHDIVQISHSPIQRSCDWGVENLFCDATPACL